MKKNYQLGFKTASAVLFLMLSLTLILQAQTPQYYNYNTTGGANVFPFGVILGKEVQLLFLPGDFNQPSPAPSGNITKLYFMMTGTATATHTTLLIKMGQATGLTTFATGVWYTGQLDTVYYRASVSLSSTTGTWMTITLDRPYNYDPTKSLIIDINTCAASVSGMNVATTSLPNFRRNTSLVNTSCPFIWGQQSGTLNNLGIDVAPPACNFTYATQTSGTTNILQSVKSISNLIGWAAGGVATVRKTTDGGATWTNANPNPGVITGDIYNIEAFDANTAWCTTSPGATFIYRTTNGGTNWTQVFTQAGGFIDAIWMVDANTGFAYGDPVAARWSLWKTTNGGVNWDSTGLYLPQAASEAGWNNAMYIIGNNIWFGTNSTKVYHSTTFGTSWTSGPTTGTVNSYSLHFNDAATGLVGGSTSAFIVRTTNGGTSYGPVLSLPAGTGNITGMTGSGTDYWALRGNNIHRSTNNGDNWTQGYTGTTALWDVDVKVSGGCPQGWAVGATGTIIKITGTPVAVHNNNNQVPDVYILSQNYPNPFNPATTISYAIPKAGNVELRVYDVLGRQVAVIVNEFRQAGSYSVNFNASELASGVYVYTIRSGDFTDTKKMVLIK